MVTIHIYAEFHGNQAEVVKIFCFRPNSLTYRLNEHRRVYVRDINQSSSTFRSLNCILE